MFFLFTCLSVFLVVCFFSVFLFVCSPLCMVIGDLSHVFALDVSPIRGQALASPPFRQRAATQRLQTWQRQPGKCTFGIWQIQSNFQKSTWYGRHFVNLANSMYHNKNQQTVSNRPDISEISRSTFKSYFCAIFLLHFPNLTQRSLFFCFCLWLCLWLWLHRFNLFRRQMIYYCVCDLLFCQIIPSAQFVHGFNVFFRLLAIYLSNCLWQFF